MEPTSKSFSGAWIVSIIIVLAVVSGGIFYISTKPNVSQVQAHTEGTTETQNENTVATTTKAEVEGSQSSNDNQALETDSATSTSVTQQASVKSAEAKTVAVPAPVVHSDWAKLTSYQGFSLQYPHKQIGVMWGDDPQLNFFISGGILNNGTTTTQVINTEINNFHLYSALGITVVKAATTVASFDTWLQDYRKTHPSRAGVDFKFTSEQKTKTTLGGLSGYLFTQVAERQDSDTVPRYVRKDIFVRDASNVYYFSYITAPTEGILSSAPKLVKQFGEYFSAAGSLSEQVLKTIRFDGSKIVSVTVPKTAKPKLVGEALTRREKLLTALRAAPYFDDKATYPVWSSHTRCSGESTTTGDETSGGSMTLAPGLYVKVDSVMASDGNNPIADVHGYDEQGWHTGPGLPIPDFGYGATMEEFAKQIRSVDYGAYHALKVRDNINGKIVIEGKKHALGVLDLSGDGNSCTIAEVFIPLTPYSVATIPMTKAGDLGPISYDIDGDGVEDFKISLLHPMLPSKTSELNAVLIDMQPEVPSMERAQTLYTPFFSNMPN